MHWMAPRVLHSSLVTIKCGVLVQCSLAQLCAVPSLRQCCLRILGRALMWVPQTICIARLRMCCGASRRTVPSERSSCCHAAGACIASCAHEACLLAFGHASVRCCCCCRCFALKGLGLFVEGQVPPGALLALFPGLVYSKDVYRWV